MKSPEEMAEELDRQACLYVSLKARNDVSYYVGMDCYRAGYQAAAPQWISVKDRLPELRQEVLVWYNNGYEVAYLQKFEPPKLQYPQFNNVEMFEWCFGDFEDFDVTHWMPLPEPPKEEE